MASKGTTVKQSNNGSSRSKGKLIIFLVELVIILAMIFALYKVMKPSGSSSSDGMLPDSVGAAENNPDSGTSQNLGPQFTDMDKEQLEIPEAVTENETMKGYMNIALFGVDAGGYTNEHKMVYYTPDMLLRGNRSDTIMIASINLETGDIKLVSVYRDTFLNTGNDKYRKCNSAYSVGGAEQAVKMLNMNLDMDIEDFVTVGYKALSDVVNGLGGIYIDVDSAELQHINNYQEAIAGSLKSEYVPMTKTGYQLVDGFQAAAYCRIRATAGDDFKRAARQREVLKAIEAQAKKADLATLTKVFEGLGNNLYTSLDTKEILELIAHINDYQIVDEDGFPQENMRTTANIGAVGSSVIPVDLESNVIWLHQFLFEDVNYEVTDTVKKYGETIKSETSRYINKTISD